MARRVSARGFGRKASGPYVPSARPHDGSLGRTMVQNTEHDNVLTGLAMYPPMILPRPHQQSEGAGHSAPPVPQSASGPGGPLGDPYGYGIEGLGNSEQHIEELSQPFDGTGTYDTNLGYNSYGDRSRMDLEGPAPERIYRPFYPAMRHLDGLLTGRYTNSNAFLPPPIFTRPATFQSVRGHRGNAVGASAAHVPATFVPRSVG